MVQTRSSSKNNTTDTNIEVNRDVAEASNKNTMNQKKKRKTTMNQKKKRKTTTVVTEYAGGFIASPITLEDLAREAFLLEYMRGYQKNHPDFRWLPDKEFEAANFMFDELVKMVGVYARVPEEIP